MRNAICLCAYYLLAVMLAAPFAAASDKGEYWTSASETSESITGDAVFFPNGIVFGDGHVLHLRFLRQITGFTDDLGDHVTARLYQLTPPDDFAMRKGNYLCGVPGHPDPVALVAIWVPEKLGALTNPIRVALYDDARLPTQAMTNDVRHLSYESGTPSAFANPTPPASPRARAENLIKLQAGYRSRVYYGY